jgi:hypothetical protein
MSEEVVDNLVNRIIELEHEANAERFLEVSEEDTSNIILNERNGNTKRVTDCHIGLLTKWLKSNNDFRNPEDIPPSELDLCLAKFFMSIRKEGKFGLEHVSRQYEPETLSAIHSSIQRHLSMKKYGNNIKKDHVFEHSRAVLAAKRKELKKLGKGNKSKASQPFTKDELDMFWSKNILGTSKCKCTEVMFKC